jgi:hypothetical protein
MSTASWTSVVTLTDVSAAELPAERLRSEGVSVEIRSDSAILGRMTSLPALAVGLRNRPTASHR